MEKQFLTVKEFQLNNNCPECFSKDGLRLTFKQRFKETPFYKKITPEIDQSIECLVCNTTIYPVRWTDDIERVFEYHKKAFSPKPTTTQYKKAFWLSLISAFALLVFIAVIIYYITF